MCVLYFVFCVFALFHIEGGRWCVCVLMANITLLRLSGSLDIEHQSKLLTTLIFKLVPCKPPPFVSSKFTKKIGGHWISIKIIDSIDI